MKIRSEQLFTALFLLKIFWLLSAEELSSVTLGGAALSAVLQGILLLPLFARGTKKIPQNRLFPAVCAAFFLYWGVRTLVRLLDVAEGVHFPVQSKLLGLLLLAAVCLYAAGLGLTALARAGLVLFGISIAALGVLLFGAAPVFSVTQLVTDGTRGLPAAALRDFCNSGGFLVSAAVLCRIDGSRRRAVCGALAAQLAATALVTVLAAGVLGRLISAADEPFFMLCAFSQPFSVQRSDALFLLLYTAIGAFSVAFVLCLAWNFFAAMLRRPNADAS